MWIDEGAVIVPGDRIDREVAPCQVLLQRDVARGVDAEAFVAPCSLALRAREGVLGVALRMEKDRKVLADRTETEAYHLLGVAANDYVVMIFHRQSEQLVAH